MELKINFLKTEEERKFDYWRGYRMAIIQCKNIDEVVNKIKEAYYWGKAFGITIESYNIED